MSMDFKIVYVFNGFNWLWRQLMLSLITMRRFVKDNIVVFYGPPRFDEHIEWLEPRCELKLVETPLNTPEFKAECKHFSNSFYGVPMKLHAYSVNSNIMIHLDCDTIIHSNILNLLRGDYDMLVGQWADGRADNPKLKANCEKLGLPYWPFQMDGFYIFKNKTHLKFKPIYEEYLTKLLKGDLPSHDGTHINLHAYNLAINHFRRDGFNVRRMPRGYHAYAGGKYVQHLANREIATWMEPKFFSEEEIRLKEIGA